MTLKINLLPWREELQEQKKRQFIAFIGLASALAIVIVLFWHFWIDQKIGHQRSNNQFLKDEIGFLDKKIAKILNLQKEKERLLARMDIIQELQGNRPNIVRLFDVVVRTVPEGLYLESITRQGAKILVEGKAESNTRVSKFMRNIESSTWLASPILSVIQANEDRSNIQGIGFNLEAIQVPPKSTPAVPPSTDIRGRV